MRRVRLTPRPDWPAKVEELGFTYHTFGTDPAGGDGVYWDESIAYGFTLTEVEAISDATEELHRLCLRTADHIAHHPALMDRFAIPESFRPLVVRSCLRRDPWIMGRFDLAYDPASGAIKMLEYNADTPTLVIETALVQWFWLIERFGEVADQFNSLHEKLIARYRELRPLIPRGTPVHVSTLPGEPRPDGAPWSPEEYQHGQYFMSLMREAGLDVAFCAMPDVGWNAKRGQFLDMLDNPIRYWAKLYPWEWLAREQFRAHLLRDTMGVIEPPWKMLLSNKALLPVLWDLFPDHPNLLPAYFEADNPLTRAGSFVAKPILAREGANMRLARSGHTLIKTGGSYGRDPVIYQGVATVPVIEGQHVILGSWVVGDDAAGMILRESESPIVTNASRVVPHFIEASGA